MYLFALKHTTPRQSSNAGWTSKQRGYEAIEHSQSINRLWQENSLGLVVISTARYTEIIDKANKTYVDKPIA